YMIIHGVPARSVDLIGKMLRPIQEARELRGRRMVEGMNTLLPRYGLRALDWQSDVRSLSRADDGGTITERHILFAVAAAIVAKAGRGPALLDFLRTALGVHPPARVSAYLADPSNETLLYDLL